MAQPCITTVSIARIQVQTNRQQVLWILTVGRHLEKNYLSTTIKEIGLFIELDKVDENLSVERV